MPPKIALQEPPRPADDEHVSRRMPGTPRAHARWRKNADANRAALSPAPTRTTFRE